MALHINAWTKTIADKQVYLLLILSFSKEIDLSVWKVTWSGREEEIERHELKRTYKSVRVIEKLGNSKLVSKLIQNSKLVSRN